MDGVAQASAIRVWSVVIRGKAVGKSQTRTTPYCGTIFTKPSYFHVLPTRSQRSQNV